MFLNNLYKILSGRIAADEAEFTLVFNPDHVIYKAHFPGEPITPGVCILQTGLELMEKAADEDLEISEVKNVKFLNILPPDGAQVTARVSRLARDGENIKAQVELRAAETSIAKMSLICRRKSAG